MATNYEKVVDFNKCFGSYLSEKEDPLLFNKLPKPDLVLFVDVNYKTMMNRLSNRDEITFIEQKFSEQDKFELLKRNYIEYQGLQLDKTFIQEFTSELHLSFYSK